MTGFTKYKTAYGHLPISTSTYVLGARIVVHQRAIYQEVFEDGAKGGLEPDIVIHPTDGDPYLDQRDRKYIASWARRTLFRIPEQNNG